MSPSEQKKPLGWSALLQLHEYSGAPLASQTFNVLRVASRTLFESKNPISIGEVEFKGVHYVPRRVGGKTLEKPHPYLFSQFAVAVSDTALQHPQAQFASQTVENLQTITTPWIGLEPIARRIFQKIGFRGLPPVVAIVATETDFTNEDGFRYGRYVSVAEPGIRVGTVGNSSDMVFTIIWGSKAWERGYATFASPQTYFTVQHELSHLLTLVDLWGNELKHAPTNEFDETSVLGRPMWEGMADCISGRVRFIARDELYRQDPVYDYNPEVTFLDQQSRTIGEAPNYLNEIFIGVLLRLWYRKGNVQKISEITSYGAVMEMLDAAFGRKSETPDNAESGWLIKKIFEESDFNYESAIRQMSNLTQLEVRKLISPLTPYPSQQPFQQRLISEFQEYAPVWNPFGNDSLVKT